MNARLQNYKKLLVPRRWSRLAALFAITLLSSVPLVAQTCVPVPSGLVGWWAGQSNAFDSLGVNNGTLQGAAGYGPGEVGTAFSFNPSSGTMIVPDSPSLRLTNQLTLEAWINTQRTNSSAPDQEIIGKIGGAAGNNGYEMTLSGNMLLGMFNTPGQGWPGNEVSNSVPIIPGTWNHVAFTYDQSALKLYFNGQPVATNVVGPLVISATSANLHVSGDDNNHGYFAGLVDEPSVYNRALSASEVAAIYNAGSAGKCPPSIPPFIVSQPVSQTVPTGVTATFSVVAEGSAPLSYQWQFNGTNIAAATSTSLTLTNVQATQTGSYSVQVANLYGSTNSSSASLTVNVLSCVPVPSGLVGWWAGQSNAFDSLGVNNGTLQGAAGYGPGEVGTAFSFNPSSGTMIVPDSPSLRLTNQLTLEAWINTQRTNSSAPDQEIIGKIGGAAGNNGYEMTLSGNMLLGMFNTPGQGWPGNEVSNSVPIIPGTWNHVAFTYDQSALKLYFNGQPVATNVVGPLVISATSANLHVSGDDNNHGYFAGLVDEPSVYNRALSASEVAAIYNAGSAGKCPTSSPPFIVSQPANQSVPSGASATFSVVAGGTAPLSYQWQVNGTNLAAATSTSLTLTNVQTTQAGSYSVVVSNLYGSTNSSGASLTVNVLSCVPAPSGLVAWWAGQSNAFDSLGVNNGTLQGAAGYGPGEVGTAFSFNPSSGTMIVPDSPSLRLTNQLTLEAWINTQRTNSSAPDQGIIGKIGGAAGNNGYSITLSGNTLLGLFNTPGQAWPGNVVSSPPLPIVLGTWNHVAFTYDQSALKLYFNGQPVATNVVGPLVISATSANLHVSGDDNNHAYFAGLIDEPSVYNRALSAGEVAAIYNAGSAGKCPPSIPPFIASQPLNQTVTSGGSATFTVLAGGTAPLSYQWTLNGTNVAGATNPSLILANVQMSQAGNYSAQVTNLYGSITSSNASLSVNPAPSIIQAVSLNATSGIVVLPINLLSQGNENALQFSISFDPTLLTFTGATLGSGATNGSLLANVNQIGSGKLGLLISLPSDASFSTGTQELAEVSFFVSPVTNTNVVAISFGDQPTVRQVSSALPSILPAAYFNGSILIPPLGIEADVFPIPNGDGSAAAIDVVQMGRFVAALDVITNASEFQRADCAPRATLGDGLLTVADWVQAGRYAAALDPLVAAGGPTQPLSGGPLVFKSGPRSANNRMLILPSATVQAGQSFQVPVQLVSQGDENGLEFSLLFDPSKFSYLNTVVGSGASGASMRLNTNSVSSGKLGLVMTLPTGATFSAATQEVARVTLNVASSANGISSLSFGTKPLPQQVASALAVDLPASYINNLLAITPITSPVLSVALAKGNLSLSWPVSATGFSLESSASLTSPTWTSVSATTVTNANEVSVTVPASAAKSFYRLQHP